MIRISLILTIFFLILAFYLLQFGQVVEIAPFILKYIIKSQFIRTHSIISLLYEIIDTGILLLRPCP